MKVSNPFAKAQMNHEMGAIMYSDDSLGNWIVGLHIFSTYYFAIHIPIIEMSVYFNGF